MTYSPQQLLHLLKSNAWCCGQGLSPEEITQCLKNVQASNGLAKLARGAAQVGVAAMASDSPIPIAADVSKRGVLAAMVRKYGAAALILSLVGVGYMRFRQQVTEQLLLQYVSDRNQRRARRNKQVAAVLDVIQNQQTQYDQVCDSRGRMLTGILLTALFCLCSQAVALLRERVARVARMQTEAVARHSLAKATIVDQRSRNQEVQMLKTTLLELKSAVLEAYSRPDPTPSVPATIVDVPPVDDISKSSPNQQPSRSTVPREDEALVSKIEPAAPAATPARPASSPKTRKSVASQTTPSVFEPAYPRQSNAIESSTNVPSWEPTPADIAELLGNLRDTEELSTARSYRLLLATK